MSKRRVTWFLHNAVVTPFIALRIALWLVWRAGRVADYLIDYLPGWRRYDGWSE